MDALQKRLFGKKSEAASEEVLDQLSLFDEAETYAYLAEAEEKSTVVAEHTRTVKKSGSLLDKLPENLETKVVEHGFMYPVSIPEVLLLRKQVLI